MKLNQLKNIIKKKFIGKKINKTYNSGNNKDFLSINKIRKKIILEISSQLK